MANIETTSGTGGTLRRHRLWLIVVLVGVITGLAPAILSAAHCHPDHGEAGNVIEVAVLVYDGVEFLDFAGPAEVFEVAGHLAEAAGRPTIDVRYLAPALAPTRTSHGPVVVPSAAMRAIDRPPDVLVVPGGGTDEIEDDPAAVALIRETAEDGIVLTVCNAALLAADLGLLDGRRATTHSGNLVSLAGREGVTALRGPRFVDAGHIVTAGGVSAGIDGALHVVERLYDPELAASVASYLQYPWPPPSTEVTIVAREVISPAERARRLFRGAAGQVLDGDYDLALEWLRASFEAGYPSPNDVFEDPELRRLAEMPEYRVAVGDLVAEFSGQ